MWKWEAENAKAVIVMVHGAAEHHGRYRWLIEMWRSNGLHVVMGDLPGQGTTTRRRGHINSFDDYMKEIKNWVQEAEKYQLPIFLLGHSMGGLAIIRTLQEYELQVEAVLLSSPCIGLVEYPPKGLEWMTNALNYLCPMMLFDSKLSVQKATRNKEVQELDSNDTLYVTKVSVRWYHELRKAMKLSTINIAKLPNIPVLLMQAGDDKIVDKTVVREWFDKLSIHEKTYKEWPGLYHEIFNEYERDDVFTFAHSFVETQLKVLG